MSEDKSLSHIVDIVTGQVKHQIRSGSDLDTIRPSPDGYWLARHVYATNTVQLEELAAGRAIWAVKWPKGKVVVDFAFSADGKTLYGAEFRGKVIAWDLATGKLRFKCGDRDHPAGRNMGVVPGSGDLVTLDDERLTLVWWDGATGAPRGKLVIDAMTDGHLFVNSLPLVTGDGRCVVFPTLTQKCLVWTLGP